MEDHRYRILTLLVSVLFAASLGGCDGGKARASDLQRACDGGDALGCYNLGVLYRDGAIPDRPEGDWYFHQEILSGYVELPSKVKLPPICQLRGVGWRNGNCPSNSPSPRGHSTNQTVRPKLTPLVGI